MENPAAYIRFEFSPAPSTVDGGGARDAAGLTSIAASTSSVYGANTLMPFAETPSGPITRSRSMAPTKEGQRDDAACLCSFLWNLPVHGRFRFFTVYGPWGTARHGPCSISSRRFSGGYADARRLWRGGRMERDFTLLSMIFVEAIIRLDRIPAGFARSAPPKALRGFALSPALAPLSCRQISGAVSRSVLLALHRDHREKELG